MLKNLLFCLVLLLWGGFVQAKTPVLLVVGDSLSAGYGINPEQGWVYLLKNRLETSDKYQQWQVINASISGDTTSGGRARLSALLDTHKPRVIILELGGNDGLRGLNLKEMRENLRIMIEKSQAAGASVILFGMKIPPNYGEAYTQRFEAVFQTLATTYKLVFVPFFLEGVAGNPEMIQADGIHPIADVQGKLLDNVWDTIKPVLTTE
ncbi:arylesterase [Beggiatoa leptomitoformis]|uniref:Arylesterase n=1 Tax=Beggiatoa leptomitoformis TaxID=288004 RepID=A0A2N9YAE0_9GAMM|nr:arylesterase [Beggiatoa leptomitoformis]ALG69337.2 arylesterase [Beggiatoa leptomitoformis]AUI67412.1 arylesterase [Beggiatoa leptomitoformis]